MASQNSSPVAPRFPVSDSDDLHDTSHNNSSFLERELSAQLSARQAAARGMLEDLQTLRDTVRSSFHAENEALASSELVEGADHGGSDAGVSESEHDREVDEEQVEQLQRLCEKESSEGADEQGADEQGYGLDFFTPEMLPSKNLFHLRHCYPCPRVCVCRCASCLRPLSFDMSIPSSSTRRKV